MTSDRGLARGHAEALDAWRRLREGGGRRVTVIDLYEMVAAPRGLDPHELPLEERLTLSRAALPAQWPGFENTAGSDRPHEPVEIVAYDPHWPEQFERWRSVISSALGETALRIEHVGSTSVPGLPAKPIIDVQVSLADLDDEVAYVDQLEAVGLQLRTRDDVHRYFRPFPDRPREVHVHVCAAGSDWERDHLLFRDYLRAHPEACAAYAATKWLAVERWHDDRLAYTDAKTDTVLDLMEQAYRWADDR